MVKKKTKGVILAGGTGSRLHPLTQITNKHLLPVYDKPMILYPLETLKNAGLDEIMIVCGKEHAGHFMSFLGSGKDYGLKISYSLQHGAGGIAEALHLTEDFADGGQVAVILGDNIFEDDFKETIDKFRELEGGMIFLKEVSDPERFGVAETKGGKILSLEEKPKNPKSNYAVTGLYLYNFDVFGKIKNLKPSGRGELEITDVNKMYLREDKLNFALVRGFWSDAGTFSSLLRATNWVAGKKSQS